MTNLLIVDDDLRLATSLSAGLQLEGIFTDIRTALSVPEALTMIEETAPTIIVCDWDFGIQRGPTGADAYRAIRAAAPYADVVVWSGLDRDVDEGVKFASKADPFTLIQLLKEIADGRKVW